MTFETLENEILYILKKNKSARGDDMTLYANYVFNHVKDLGLGLVWLQKIFSDRKYRIELGISPYSSVSRVRRMVQEKHPELLPDAKEVKERKQYEANYKAYAKKNKSRVENG